MDITKEDIEELEGYKVYCYTKETGKEVCITAEEALLTLSKEYIDMVWILYALTHAISLNTYFSIFRAVKCNSIKNKLLIIMSGMDWYDACCNHYILQCDIPIEKLRNEYSISYNEKIKYQEYITFEEWLLSKKYIRKLKKSEYILDDIDTF